MRRRIVLLIMSAFMSLALQVGATDYFVGKTGDDGNDGLSREAAFLTVQKGVDALKPGDVLTIGPGEYFGSVKRAKLGGPDADTVIRAEIPGTVVLRGDVPAPPFKKVKGRRFVYATDFDHEGDVQAVNELDTLTILRPAPNVDELDFTPGKYHYDRETKKLYISTSDLASAEPRRYTVSMLEGSMMEFTDPRRLRLEGLAATGAGRRGSGFSLLRANECVTCDCRAYFNSDYGIIVNSGYHWRGGNNVVERCVAWANAAGMMLFYPRTETLRDSKTFRNTSVGVRIYARAKGMSRLRNHLSWGNGMDIHLKTGAVKQSAERCVGPGPWGGESRDDVVSHCLIGSIRHGPGKHWENDIVLEDASSLNPHTEFADPVNHDYRLQSTSRFRGAGKDGVDLGPFPYEANIFYVSPKGNDRADGLSAANAWATLGKAARSLRPGDTLYLEPGRYGGAFRLDLGKRTEGPISIRGRGDGVVELTGAVNVSGGRGASFERLRFTRAVGASDVEDLRFDQCAFSGDGTALSVRDVKGLRITHCEFRGSGDERIALSGCSGVFLGGNWFDNAAGAAVSVDRTESVAYAGYDCYRRPAEAWRIAGKVVALDRLPHGWERYGTTMASGEDRPGIGLFDRPAGNYRVDPEKVKRVVGPFVHSTGATSANLEWFSSEPGTVEIAWGETPSCEKTLLLNSECFGSFSLNGLKPDTTYYFQLRTAGPALPQVFVPLNTKHAQLRLARRALASNEGWQWGSKPISFKTLDRSPEPVTYYVAPDGDDGNSGRERGDALRTLTRACELVRPGDAVRVAGGVYRGRLRVRATGEPGRPITFAAIPGERVVLDGDDRVYYQVISFNKSHLRLDGFHLQNVTHTAIWTEGAFRFFGGEDIQLTRCIYDGRGPGYPPSFVYAGGVKNLLVKNCVSVNAFSFSPRVLYCPGFRMEHCVNFHNLNGGTYIGGVPGDPVRLSDNIFTDCQLNKVKVGIGPMASEKGLVMKNNAWFFRPERTMQGDHHMVTGTVPMKDFAKMIEPDDGLIGDPRFAILCRDGADPGEGFTAQRLISVPNYPVGSLTFADFFATNPEFVKRRIGLNPDDFKDFNPKGKDHKPMIIVMMGDSTTLSRRSEGENKLTSQVDDALRKLTKRAFKIVNSGKGGDTIKGAFTRLDKDVFAHNPDVVTLSFGLNDTGTLTPKQYGEWLRKVIDAIQKKSPKIKIMLVTSTPFDDARHAWRKKFADKGGLDTYMNVNICDAARGIAKEKGLPLCDLHAIFAEEFKTNPESREKVIRQDGVHLTAEGNKQAARHLAPAIGKMMDSE